MGHVTQKIIQLIHSEQVVDDLMPIASYSLSFLVNVIPGDEIDSHKHLFRVSELIDIYQKRERNLKILGNTDYGGFSETVNSLRQIDSPVVGILSVVGSGYYFDFLLEMETETIVGILYVKQPPGRKPGSLSSFSRS